MPLMFWEDFLSILILIVMKRITILLLSICVSCMLFAHEELDYYESFLFSMGDFTSFTAFPEEVQSAEDKVIWRFNVRYGLVASNENDPIFKNASLPLSVGRSLRLSCFPMRMAVLCNSYMPCATQTMHLLIFGCSSPPILIPAY